MKLPLSWLKEFVTIDASLDELCRRLTMAGFNPAIRGAPMSSKNMRSNINHQPTSASVGPRAHASQSQITAAS